MSASQPYRIDTPGAGPVLPRPAGSRPGKSIPMPPVPPVAEPPAVRRAAPIAPSAIPTPAAGKPSAPQAATTSSAGPKTGLSVTMWSAIGGGVLVVALGAAYFFVRTGAHAAAAPVVTEGAVNVNSSPAGATVVVDGTERGVTPLRLSLPVGAHTLELGQGAAKRRIPITVSAGLINSEYIDLTAAVTASVGAIDVTSTPSGAQVQVDGAARGATPISLANMAPGAHTVTVSNADTTVTNTVIVTAGATATVAASMAAPAPGAGWVAVKAPFEMQIFEGGKLIGTTSADRIMLSPGKHDFQLVADTFAFKAPLSVDIKPGKTDAPVVTVPNGSLSINVDPWAEVFLDGQDIGTTPLANIAVPIGAHEIVWRHPGLGERKRTVAVTTQAPVRLGLNFTDR